MHVNDVASDLGPLLIDCPSADFDGARCTVRLRALPLIPDAADDAQRVADAIRHFADRYIAAEGTLGAFSVSDVARALGWSDTEFRRVSLLLAGAGGIFQSSGRDAEGRLTTVTLSSDILLYEGIRTLDGYFAAAAAEDERRRRRIATDGLPTGQLRTRSPAGGRVRRERSSPPSLPWAGLHPRVVTQAEALFCAGHRNDAVRRALVDFEERVRQRLQEAGAATPTPIRSADLMGRAFGGAVPAIAISALQTESDKNEQRGFAAIAQGAMAAIRNVLTHENRAEMSAEEALERLALASYLHRTLDAAESAQPQELPGIERRE